MKNQPKLILENYKKAVKIAKEFHFLAHIAARNGGFWVSAGGGTANIIAGIISRSANVDFKSAHKALNETGGNDWYMNMAMAQPWRLDAYFEETPGRWNVSTIVSAAIYRVK